MALHFKLRATWCYNCVYIFLLVCIRASFNTYENDLVNIFVLSIAVEVAVTSWHCSCSCSDSSSSRGSCCRILEDPSTRTTPRWTPTWRTFEEPWGQESNEGRLVWCVCSATAIRFKPPERVSLSQTTRTRISSSLKTGINLFVL